MAPVVGGIFFLLSARRLGILTTQKGAVSGASEARGGASRFFIEKAPHSLGS
uniref:Uncharacterized protein n=1 Tax=mine drainage metagenome TaxID=410659 RepID=E6Q248_9ZZZZ